MRRFATEDDIFKIRDKIVKAYLKMILVTRLLSPTTLVTTLVT